MPKKSQVDTPFVGSWADEQTKQSVAAHHWAVPVVFQEEQKLMNTHRRFPSVRNFGQKYAEDCEARCK